MTGTRFWVGEEDTLEHYHLGRVAFIDHHVRSASRVVGGVTEQYAWFLHVHCGTIVGFVEDRGRVVLAPNEKPDGMGDYPDYKVKILLEDGRKITIEEHDRCSIYFPEVAS